MLGKLETAKSFLLEGLDVSIVAKCTNLPLSEVDRLKKDLSLL